VTDHFEVQEESHPMKTLERLSHLSRRWLFLLLAATTLSVWFGYLYRESLADSAAEVLAATALVQGQVVLQGNSNNGGVLVTTTESQVETTPDGNFTIAVDSPFVLNLTAPSYLDVRVEGIIPAGTGTLVLERITMLAGELTGDDRIDIFDLAVAGTSYGSGDLLADINRDGIVNILDLALVGSNYGAQGPIIIIVNGPEPTATLTPSATSIPTSTSTPTSTPSPTPTATVEPTLFLTGSVLDPGGQGVAGAEVTITGPGVNLSVTTGSDGSWSAGPVAPGEYEFEASASGYATWPEPRQITISDETDEIVLTLAPPTNAVAEGDFDGDFVWDFWDRFDGDIQLTADAFDGEAAALLGTGVGQEVTCWQNNQPGELWTLLQTVTVPNIDQPGLSFVYKINTTQTTSFDYAWAEVVLIADGQPYYLVPWGQVWQATDDWTLVALDLSQWRGQTIDLRFQVVHCSSQSLSATIDRVSIGEISDTLAPPPTPINNVDYVGVSRRLTACENNGKNHLFITVEDLAGNGLADVKLRVFWPDGEAIIETGHKQPEFGPGYVDFPMFTGTYWVEVLDTSSQVVGPLTVDIFVDEPCEETGNPVGNSPHHYSYEVVFTKVR
jgi:hypothetical protein